MIRQGCQRLDTEPRCAPLEPDIGDIRPWAAIAAFFCSMTQWSNVATLTRIRALMHQDHGLVLLTRGPFRVG